MMDKEKELVFKMFVRGFNYAIQYCLMNQEISGKVISLSYPLIEELKEQFNNNYLDVLLREQDKKEKEGNKRDDWCYIHNEEKDCYNEDGDHDDYQCRKCEGIRLPIKKQFNKKLKKWE